jgi:NADH-quinone oxidoreductase subunit H
MAFSSIELSTIAAGQGEALNAGGFTVKNWSIFIQPLGFLIFLTATYAETNRLPFDLPESRKLLLISSRIWIHAICAVFMAEYSTWRPLQDLLQHSILVDGNSPGMSWLLEMLRGLQT